MEWNHSSELSIDLDLYEDIRHGNRRFQSEFKIPPEERMRMLKDSGYSSKEIQKAQKTANIIRRKRLRTYEMLHTQKMEESFEAIRRTFMKPFQKRSKKIKEKVLVDKNRDQDYSGERSELDTSNRRKIHLSQDMKNNNERPLDTTNRNKINISQDIKKNVEHLNPNDSDKYQNGHLKNERNYYLTDCNERNDNRKFSSVQSGKNTLDTDVLSNYYEDTNKTDSSIVDIQLATKGNESTGDSLFCHPNCGSLLESVKHALHKIH